MLGSDGRPLRSMEWALLYDLKKNARSISMTTFILNGCDIIIIIIIIAIINLYLLLQSRRHILSHLPSPHLTELEIHRERQTLSPT